MQEVYKKGDIVKCIVTGITEYGIFVKVDDSINGLIHISEVSENFVRDINEFASVGETIYSLVLEETNDNQLKLSIKNINYKENNNSSNIKETRLGFWPLKNNLDKWIQEKIDEYK